MKREVLSEEELFDLPFIPTKGKWRRHGAIILNHRDYLENLLYKYRIPLYSCSKYVTINEFSLYMGYYPARKEQQFIECMRELQRKMMLTTGKEYEKQLRKLQELAINKIIELEEE